MSCYSKGEITEIALCISGAAVPLWIYRVYKTLNGHADINVSWVRSQLNETSLSKSEKVFYKLYHSCIDRKATKQNNQVDISGFSQEENFDLLILIGEGSVVPRVNVNAKTIWFLGSIEEKTQRPTELGFRESLLSRQTASIGLFEINQKNYALLSEAVTTVDRFSIANTKRSLMAHASTLIAKGLRDYRSSGHNESENCSKASYKRLLPNKKPSLLWLSFVLFRKIIEKFIQLILNLLFFEQWILRFQAVDSQESVLVEDGAFQDIVPPKNKFWADPHLVQHNGKHFLFIEELCYERGRGHIAVGEFGETGFIAQPVVAIKEPFHLSNPFVFKMNGEFYLIPESSENGSIDLYKCNDFPTSWTKVKTLMEGVTATDATIVTTDGFYWMFVTMADNEDQPLNDCLHIFYTDDLLFGSWKAHKNNPIFVDCSKARMAGRFLKKDSFLVRPVQDCSRRYGYGTKFMQVVELSTENYRERELSSLYPHKLRDLATHAYSVDYPYIVSDKKVLRFRY